MKILPDHGSCDSGIRLLNFGISTGHPDMPKKPAFVTALLLAILAVAVVVSATRLMSKTQALRDASENLESCRKLASEISKARQTPSRAVAKASSSMEITKQIEEAARGMNLPATTIVVIEPQAPRRIADSPYKLRVIQVDLKPLLLPEVIALLHHILQRDPTLVVSSLRLSSPARSNDTTANAIEQWAPEITLTNLIYDPTTPLPSK